MLKYRMDQLTSNITSVPEVREPWMRLPKAGERLWGLARTQWLKLCQRQKVKSILLREPGAKRGIRLIQRKSAIRYFNHLSTQHRTALNGK